MSNSRGSDGNIGPTKRSVDVPEYVELEGRHAKLGQDYAQLMSLYNQLKIKLREANQVEAFLKHIAPLVEYYVTIRDLSEKLRKENNKASRNHKTEGHGAFSTPEQVINATRDWTVSAINLADTLAERLGK